MALSLYFYNFLNGNTIKILIGHVVVVVVGGVVPSTILFINGLIVTLHIAFIENKGKATGFCWNEGRNICFDGAHACTHLLLMLSFFLVRERGVFPSSMAQDLVHLCHQCYKGIINGTNR